MIYGGNDWLKVLYDRLHVNLLKEGGLTPKSIMEIGSIQSMKQLAISGLGIIPF